MRRKLVKVGEVKVRKSSKNNKKFSYEITIPREVLLFIDLKEGEKLSVYVDQNKEEVVLRK